MFGHRLAWFTIAALLAATACQTGKTKPSLSAPGASFGKLEGTVFEPYLHGATITKGNAGKVIRVIVRDRQTLVRQAQQLIFYIVGEAKEKTTYEILGDCFAAGISGVCVDYLWGSEREQATGKVEVAGLPAVNGDPFSLTFQVATPSGRRFEGNVAGVTATE